MNWIKRFMLLLAMFSLLAVVNAAAFEVKPTATVSGNGKAAKAPTNLSGKKSTANLGNHRKVAKSSKKKKKKSVEAASAKASPRPTVVSTPSPTKKLVAEKKFSDRCFQFSWEEGVASFSSQSEDPQGFSTTTSNNIGQKFSAEFIIDGKVGISAARDSSDISLEKKVYEASIGTVEIADSWKFMAKVYPIKDDHWLPYVGVGVKFADINNKLMIGGTSFPHKDTTSSAVFEVGSIFPITNDFGFIFSGELYKLGSVSSIPFTVDTSTFATVSIWTGLAVRL
jgi:opacity protein-like surface antigen